MSFANRKVLLNHIEDQRVERRRHERESILASQGKSTNQNSRENRLAAILEQIKPTRSRRPQLIIQELTYIAQILGQVLLEENPVDNPNSKKKVATMYVKLVDMVNSISSSRQVPPADSTMGPTDGTQRQMPPAQPSAREISTMSPQSLRLWHMHRRDAMRRDATKYPTGYPVGTNK